MKLKNVKLCFKTESRSLLDIYNPKTGVVKVQPPKWKRKRVMTLYIFVRFIYFKGPKSPIKIYLSNSCVTKNCKLRQNRASDKKVEESNPQFFN